MKEAEQLLLMDRQVEVKQQEAADAPAGAAALLFVWKLTCSSAGGAAGDASIDYQDERVLFNLIGS